MFVSIPRGAVKSFEVTNYGRVPTKFQFQEVQLKDLAAKELMRQARFQFQEVQLKA